MNKRLIDMGGGKPAYYKRFTTSNRKKGGRK